MALDVGELVARLTIEDDRFIRTLQNDERQLNSFEQVVRQATGRIDTGFRDSAQSVERLGTASQGASRDVSRVGQSASDISRVGTESRQAARQVDEIGDAARAAAEDVEDLSGALDDAATGAGDAGGDAGGSFLSGFSNAISDIASKTGPVAGSILGVAALGVGAGIALAAAIKEGMENELSRDMFQAQTRTTEAQAEKFARAAGEAYADVFGSSVEENLSTLKLAVQQNIIDPGATQRDAEAVVANLDTITQALDGEVSMSVQAVSALMSTGLAGSAQEAADMIANAVGGSANKGEDLLEIINEYASGWKNAGISAEQSLALLEQATDSGAWTADVAGDAIREWGRRMSEESEAVTEALNDMGFEGEEMFARLSAGGEDSNVAFDEMLDRVRSIEDPLKRNQAIAALLGDTAGDFYDVFASWDPSEALKNMGEFDGAAGRLAATMGGNAATSVEGAFRSIDTVIGGLKAALAEAFGPQIAEWANNISNNRAGVIEFFIGVGNAGFEAGEAVLRFVEGGLRGLAQFAGSAAEAGASFLDMGANILAVGENIPMFGDLLGLATDGASDKLRDLADATRNGGEGIDRTLTGAANAIHDTLIPGLQAGQERFNEFAGNMKLSAAFNDQSAKVAASIAGIGIAADGSTMDLSNFNGQIDHTNTAQHEMDLTARGLADGFREQVRTGIEAGNTIETLDGQYRANLDTLRQQLMATGMSNQAANDYIKTLGLTPELVNTLIEQEGMPEAHYALDVLNDKVVAVPDSKTVVVSSLTDDAKSDLEALGLVVTTLPDGTVSVTANTDEGQRIIEEWRTRRRTLEVQVVPRTEALRQQGLPSDFIGPVNVVQNAIGNVYEPHDPQIGDGKTTRIWNEPETEGESYIPHAMSKRQRAEQILGITAEKFGFGLVKTFAEGGVISKDGHDAMKAWAQSMDPVGYGMGGFSTSSIDCSGAVSGAINKALGLDAFDSRMSTVTEGSWLQAKGAILGRGPEGTVRVGWWDEGGGANGHTAMTFADGTNFESNGSEGVVVGGQTGWDDPSFTDHAWFPNLGDLGLASDTGNGTSFTAENDPDGSKAFAAGEFTERYRQAYGVEEDQVAMGTTESGALLSTDGQRVYVTNWPSSLGGTEQAKPEDERVPILTAGLKVFANGGIDNLPAQAGIYQDGANVVGFAERGTGGEGYVPLSPAKRPRSVAITKEIANRFGYQLVPMADGGLTGFGGWQDSDRPTLDIPLDGRPQSAAKQRANANNLLALGIGGLNTLLSGFDGRGNFTGQFDTGSNSPALLEEGVSLITSKLDELIEAAKNPDPVDVQVDIDQGSRTANLAITKRGL
ncbi:hypothetical protein CH267_02155 [Rhodococcus sp. 06-621-2]|nr:phage tail tape measure protein [Rhodococcus sp. 06-621-2]OZC62362.1 hypothetical protein CH267_02155 [Rhodococcus sp. 06-621-2]